MSNITTPFQLTDNFNMTEFNGMLNDINTNTIAPNIDISTTTANLYDTNNVDTALQMIAIAKTTITLTSTAVGKVARIEQGAIILTQTATGSTIVFDVPKTGTWNIYYDNIGVGSANINVGDSFVKDVGYKIMTLNIDLTNSNPATCATYADDAVTMTAGGSDWDAWFGIKPCLFKNGAVVGYLNPNNFTQFADGSAADITSGNAGDVMIEFPRLGLNITTVGNTLTISMTNNPNNSSFNYLAHTRGSTNKDYFYLGAYKGYTMGGQIRSLSGKAPTTSQTIGTFRTQAQANGAGYEQSGFYQLIFRQAMYLLKYKNLDSQTALGRGYVDGNSAAIATGGTNAKGMDFGETTGKLQMKLFGLEDFWGNVHEWIDGLVSTSTWNMLTTTDNFNDTGAGYMDNGQGASANIGNYMSKPQGTTKTGFIAKEVTGSGSTYFCDYASLYSSCVASFGSGWGDASGAGAFCLLVYIAASYSGAAVGARLMFL